VVVTNANTGLFSTRAIEIDTSTDVAALVSLTVVGMSPDGYVDGTKPIRIQTVLSPTQDYPDTTGLQSQWQAIQTAQTGLLQLWGGTLLSSNTSFNLVIKPNVIPFGLPYLCRLTVTSPSAIFSTQGDIQFTIYPLPTGGTLTVSPTTGDFSDTLFTLGAPYWSYVPLFYFYFLFFILFFKKPPLRSDPTGSTITYLQYNFAVQQTGYPQYFLRQTPSDNPVLVTQNLPIGNLIITAYIYSP